MKITQCSSCGKILDQNVDLEEHHNLVALCLDCYYKHILNNSLAGMPIIDDFVDPQIIH